MTTIVKTLTLTDLLETSYGELDELFRNSPAGEIPDGDSEGRALFFPGTFLAKPLAWIVRMLFWKGKVVDRKRGFLLNKILPFGIKAIKAQVYGTESWLDKKPCVVLDYSKTSFVAHFIRDEIRLVAPHLYLGIVYIGKLKTIHFAIQFMPGA
ncbi:MAG TPA: hypothetical protein VGN88_11310 [Phycisphaerae bacterium]